jgi:hypothetical protein
MHRARSTVEIANQEPEANCPTQKEVLTNHIPTEEQKRGNSHKGRKAWFDPYRGRTCDLGVISTTL